MKTAQTLEAMKGYYAKNSILPSYSEIMEMTGIKSKNSVSMAVCQLIDDGIFEKTANNKLKPTQKFFYTVI